MEIYDYVVAEAPGRTSVRFSVPFEHKTSELRVLCCINNKAEYVWSVYDAGVLTEVEEGVYVMQCPFGDMLESSTWKIWVWRLTSATESVKFDEKRVPVEEILSKLIELTRKTEENAEECGRALRVPEGDSAAFYPPKEVRANEIAGFDEEGRPAVGRRIKQVDDILDLLEKMRELYEEMKRVFEEFKEWIRQKKEELEAWAEDFKKWCENFRKELEEWETKFKNWAYEFKKALEEWAADFQMRMEAIYEELTQYRYCVLTREEYDKLFYGNEKLDPETIYFVKGNFDVGQTLYDTLDKYFPDILYPVVYGHDSERIVPLLYEDNKFGANNTFAKQVSVLGVPEEPTHVLRAVDIEKGGLIDNRGFLVAKTKDKNLPDESAFVGKDSNDYLRVAVATTSKAGAVRLAADINDSAGVITAAVLQDAIVNIEDWASGAIEGKGYLVAKVFDDVVPLNGASVGKDEDGYLRMRLASTSKAGAVRLAADINDSAGVITAAVLQDAIVNIEDWASGAIEGKGYLVAKVFDDVVPLNGASVGKDEDGYLRMRLASTSKAGAVRLAMSIDDGQGVVNAPLMKSAIGELRTEINTDFAKFEPSTSGAETGAKHGKSLLASQNGEDGGLYVGANKSATRFWTQWLTRYQQNKIRVYGPTNNEYEDFRLVAENEEERKLKIARIQDVERLDNPTLILTGEGDKTEEPDENANVTAWVGTLGALKGLDEDDATAIVPHSMSVWKRTAGTTVNATLNMRMKIMRWDEASGAWAIAAKSKETRMWSDYANGEEIKFTFAWEGEGIPANEKVIIGFVRMSDEDAAGTFTQASCAQTTTRSGAMTVAPGLSTREPAVQEYAPVMRLGTARVLTPDKLRELVSAKTEFDAKIAALEARIAALEGA